MQSRKLSAGIALAALAAAVALFVVLRGEEDPEPATPPVTEEAEQDPAPDGREPDDGPPEAAEPEIETIVLRDGQPVGGVAELSFRRGERIELAVRSNTDEELHLHGYDVVENVEAGGRVRFDVPAELEGVFEVELHPSHVPVAEITVRP